MRDSGILHLIWFGLCLVRLPADCHEAANDAKDPPEKEASTAEIACQGKDKDQDPPQGMCFTGLGLEQVSPGNNKDPADNAPYTGRYNHNADRNTRDRND